MDPSHLPEHLEFFWYLLKDHLGQYRADIPAQLILLAATIQFALAAAAWLRVRKRRDLVEYGYLALNLALVYLCMYAEVRYAQGSFEEITMNANRPLTFFMGCLLTVTVMRFYSAYLDLMPREHRKLQWVAWLTVIAGFICAVASSYSNFDAKGLETARQIIGIIAGAIIFGCVAGAWVADHQRGAMTAQKKYFALTAIALLSSGFAAWIHEPFWLCFAAVPTCLLMLYLMEALIKVRLPTSKEILRLALQVGGIVVSCYLIVIIESMGQALRFPFPIAIDKWSQQEWRWPFGLLHGIVIVLILVDPIRERISPTIQQLGAFLGADLSELSACANRLRDELGSSLEEINQLAEAIALGLHGGESKVTCTSVFLLDQERNGFRREAAQGELPVRFISRADAQVLLDDMKHLRVFTEDDLQSELEEVSRSTPAGRERSTALMASLTVLERMKAQLCIPIVRGRRDIVGFLNLRSTRIPHGYSQEELIALIRLSDCLARAFEKSQIREQERTKTFDMVQRVMVHEIGNALVGISSTLQRMKPSDPSLQERMTMIREEVERIYAFLEDVGTYAGSVKLERCSTDVNEVVQKAIHLFQQIPAGRIQLESELSDVGQAEVDPGKLRQVLLNLLLNAREAMGEQGGTLRVRTLRAPGRGSPTAQIQIIDSGPGIEPRLRAQIFQPIESTKRRGSGLPEEGKKERGSGLGLAICKRIIDAHGGTISFESEEGRGTTFMIQLPCTEAPIKTPPPAEVSAPPAPGKEGVRVRAAP